MLKARAIAPAAALSLVNLQGERRRSWRNFNLAFLARPILDRDHLGPKEVSRRFKTLLQNFYELLPSTVNGL